MFPRILGRVVEWVKAHKQFGLEFEERGSRTLVFVRTWRRDSFYRGAVGVIDRYHGDAGSKLVIFGQVLCAIGSGASLVSVSGGSDTLVECHKGYLGCSELSSLYGKSIDQSIILDYSFSEREINFILKVIIEKKKKGS